MLADVAHPTGRPRLVSEPTACGAARCDHDLSYCSRCDLLVGLDGLHVLGVVRDEDAGVLGWWWSRRRV